MIDLRGIAFLGFTGAGALAGCVLALPVMIAATFFPEVMSWVWLPIAAGTTIGAVAGIITQKR